MLGPFGADGKHWREVMPISHAPAWPSKLIWNGLLHRPLDSIKDLQQREQASLLRDWFLQSFLAGENE